MWLGGAWGCLTLGFELRNSVPTTKSIRLRCGPWTGEGACRESPRKRLRAAGLWLRVPPSYEGMGYVSHRCIRARCCLLCPAAGTGSSRTAEFSAWCSERQS